MKCEQGCGAAATVYAMDSIPDGWGGYYCCGCAEALHFNITDVVRSAPSWTLRKSAQVAR